MSKQVQINLEEVVEIFLFLEELNHFFQNPDKYNDQELLSKYVEEDMYPKLHKAYYDTVWHGSLRKRRSRLKTVHRHSKTATEV